VIGDEKDVLSRLIKCGQHAGATDIFRVTSESPFVYHNLVKDAWNRHLDNGSDATFLDDIIDGCGFEILNLSALQTSHAKGEDKHRSELCTLYIRENKDVFKVDYITPPVVLKRKDLRLTVDYPEDLILCRAVYEAFKHQLPRVELTEVVEFLDRNPDLKRLTAPFCEAGYSTMYL
jgi:spore coat polysaccharide biosynthesis protein SpsF